MVTLSLGDQAVMNRLRLTVGWKRYPLFGTHWDAIHLLLLRV